MIRSDELIVDNFAGGGGASHGIFLATGRHPDIAINHDPEALAMHRANHPTTRHFEDDVFSVDPVKLCAGRPVGLAWFSPDCKHFSKAKGGKPVSKKIRGLAWVVVKWAAAVKPRIIHLENVEEFQTWGPLHRQHTHGCHGNHRRQTRDRHGFKIDYIDGKAFGCKPECRLGHPIVELAGVTFRFWWKKLERLGYRVEMKELRACDNDTPTIRKRLFIVARCDGLPIVWPEATHGTPKSEAVKSGRLKPWRTAADCIDWSIPCPSIFERERPLAENTLKRIARGIQRYVIDSDEPFIVRIGQTGGNGAYSNSVDDPLTTVTSKAEHCLVSPVLAGVGGRAGQSRERSGDEPLQTITAKGDTVVVAPFLAPRYGERDGQAPRCQSADGPVPTITPTANGARLVAAFLAQHNGGPRNENMAGRAAEAPLSTITHRGTQQQIVAAHLARHTKDSAGTDAASPVGTILARGKDSLVTSHLVKLKGTCRHGQETGKPMPTIAAGGLHVGEVRAFLIEYYSNGSGKTGAPLDKPSPTVTANDRLGLVTIHGVDYQIVDIGMRMLQPRELYRAQGFDDSYIIEWGIDEDGNRITLTKSAQVRMCGNSVCPPLAAAIVRAQLAATGEDESRAERPAKQMGLI